MAKSVPVKGRASVPQVANARGGLFHGIRVFFGGVWSELRKTAWPTRTELSRMTAVVLTTVVIFALLIGGADFVLGYILNHFVYNTK